MIGRYLFYEFLSFWYWGKKYHQLWLTMSSSYLNGMLIFFLHFFVSFPNHQKQVGQNQQFPLVAVISNMNDRVYTNVWPNMHQIKGFRGDPIFVGKFDQTLYVEHIVGHLRSLEAHFLFVFDKGLCKWCADMEAYRMFWNFYFRYAFRFLAYRQHLFDCSSR